MKKPQTTSKLEILWQSDELVAVAKPSGLAAIPGRDESESLIEVLARQLDLPWKGSNDPRLRIVHRLDKETSGVMLLAKSLDAQRSLSEQFQNNLVEKEYVALVAGKMASDSGEIDAQIGVHSTNRRKMAVLKHGGRPARTMWRVEARYRPFTLLRVFPKTGKTHQIRVHLAHVDHPLAIDAIYNPAAPPILLSSFKRGYNAGARDERPLIARLTLHAEKLRFADRAGTIIEVTAPVPKDFRAVLNMLGKYGRN